MTMEYICRTYRVPAKAGGRVEYSGGPMVQQGTIMGATMGGRLKIKMDGEEKALPYHPTWKLEYLPGEGEPPRVKP